MRKYSVIAFGLIILIIANYTIYSRENIIRDGKVVLLELVPVDPRSLMQGDFMRLRFSISNKAFGRSRHIKDKPKDGYEVLTLDNNLVGSFVRLDKSNTNSDNNFRIRYRIRNGRVKIATNAWFFQEGDGKRFEAARYGEFRVSDTGLAILTQMRDSDFNVL
ncbi:MAG: GDYXXLXY domain-containing protein [Proteobacteria bacterium]|nr:GDYXXLXY domain-containing protein [Pseudomonadota bacterium]